MPRACKEGRSADDGYDRSRGGVPLMSVQEQRGAGRSSGEVGPLSAETGAKERAQGLSGFSLQKPVVLLAVTLGVGCAWWNLLHEVAFYYMITYEAQAINCFVGFGGGVAAGVGVLCLRRFAGFDVLSPRICWALFVVGCVLIGTYYGLLQYEGLYGWATLCYFALNVAFYYFVIGFITLLVRVGFSQVVFGLFLGGLVYACLEIALQPLFFSGQLGAFDLARDGIIAGVHLTLFVVSFVLALCSIRAVAACGTMEGETIGYRPFKAAAPVVFVLLAYSIIFGMMHNLASGIVGDPVQKVLPSHLGMLLGAVVFFATFSISPSTGRIWARMRQVVFPITMIGFILLPLSQDRMAAISVVAGECATVNFYLIFLLACVSISRRTGFDPVKVGALGVAVATLGFLVGDFGSSDIRTLNLLGTPAYVFLTVFAFVLLVAATFWTGDDRKAALLWGMEEKRAPRKYDDARIQERCEALIERFALSTREGEVLHMLAQGKKPQQITEELFISLATVRSHVHSIYVKLGIHSNAQLMELVESGAALDK